MPNGGKRAGAGRPRGTTGPQAQTIAKQEEAARRTRLTAQKWWDRVEEVVDCDVGLLIDETGRLKPLHAIPPEIRRTIQSVKLTKRNLEAGDGTQEDVVEIKLWDKMKALEMAGRAHGLFEDKLKVTSDRPLREKVAAARRRIAAARGKS